MTAADLVAGARALIEPLTGHTPGEWEMSVTHPTNACANVRCGYTDVATLYGGDSDVPQPADDEPWGPQPIRDANARLTAASPALRDTVADLADLAEVQAQRVEEWRQDYRALEGAHRVMREANARLIAERDALTQRIEALEAALRFYIDPDNWLIGGPLDGDSPNYTGGPGRDALQADEVAQ